MRTGLGAGRSGYVHEALCYASDDDLLGAAMPFLAGGVEAGEPTVAVLTPERSALVRAQFPADTPITFLDSDERYSRPAATIKAYRQMLGDFVRDGATQIRVLGDLPPATFGMTWPWWCRYEAAINHAYDDFPLWSLCAYDSRLAPAEVIDDVRYTHPHLATPTGQHLANTRFRPPAELLGIDRHADRDPMESAAPLIDLTDPSPVEARRAVLGAERAGLLPSVTDISTLVMVIHEAVANGIRHGAGPVRLRLWSAPDRIVAAIGDRGPGPTDPFAGLWPATATLEGGMGLWLIHELCDYVSMETTDTGYTLRLTMGRVHGQESRAKHRRDEQPAH